ncbi:type VI secretion system TssO [Tenacibaculum sp. SDUM215027]|uniref:type VI secretion system TssO n=1 Tax=Tenacibaculum sp. SDUM215027 TaxID=3422596 RepID=UPI003D32367E
MDNHEVFWEKIRFSLLFIIISTVVFIILTKFVFKVPVIESKELLNSIDASEEIFDIQEEYTKKIKNTHEKIQEIPFDVIQIQVLDELDKEIQQYKKIYRDNDMNNRYIFGVQSSKTLKMFFDLSEEYNALKRNNKVLKENLEECKANI